MALTDRTLLGGMTLGDVMNYLEEEMGAVASAVLPELPEDDGTYTLQVVIDDGKATYSWEAVEAAGT